MRSILKSTSQRDDTTMRLIQSINDGVRDPECKEWHDPEREEWNNPEWNDPKCKEWMV